jgi:sugar phosphate isomerase/epimerase
VADFGERIDPTTLERAQVSLKHAAQLAASFDVRLALEFRGAATWCASLDTALAMLDACGEANLGINFDVFHYYTGPSKFEDLNHLTRFNLDFVQLCDLAGVPRELATDADRILPGDGDFQLQPILDHFRKIGYEGWVSVELMNPDLWKMKPVQVAEAATTALRRLLGQTAMAEGHTRQEFRPSPRWPDLSGGS